MTESQFIDEYLDTVTEGGRPLTPVTFLNFRLRGRAALYKRHYLQALVRALDRRIAAGLVRPIRLTCGSVAFERIPACIDCGQHGSDICVRPEWPNTLLCDSDYVGRIRSTAEEQS